MKTIIKMSDEEIRQKLELLKGIKSDGAIQLTKELEEEIKMREEKRRMRREKRNQSSETESVKDADVKEVVKNRWKRYEGKYFKAYGSYFYHVLRETNWTLEVQILTLIEGGFLTKYSSEIKTINKKGFEAYNPIEISEKEYNNVRNKIQTKLNFRRHMIEDNLFDLPPMFNMCPIIPSFWALPLF